MATWQADFRLVPRGALDGLGAVDVDAVRERYWWEGFSLPADYAARLAAVAPLAASWSPALEVWGTKDGNRIDVWREGGRVTDVLVRVDTREIDHAFIAGVLAFALHARCVIMGVTGAIAEPNLGEFMLALRATAAFRFVAHPALFLRRLALGGLEDM